MSGGVASHAAYNGSGTQALAATNTISDDGDVASVFWSAHDTTKQILYGSAIVEVPASGNGGSLSGAGNQIFAVNNDIDALGDLYLQITLTGTTGQLSASGTILDVIKRVEFHVGTQVWQTLEHDDIFALNSSEMSEGAFESYFQAIAGGVSKDGLKNEGVSFVHNTHDSGARRTHHSQHGAGEVTCVVRLPGFSRTVGPALSGFANVSEGSYLLGAAPHQNVKIKVFTNKVTDLATVSGADFTGVELKLFGKQHIMCNAEREQLKAMTVPKRIKTSQSHSTVASTITKQSDAVVNLDLDHFSLFTSHLIIGLDKLDCHVKTAELKLNSSSFSGELSGSLLTGPAADAMGLYHNQYYSQGVPFAHNYYIFPLASRAYGSSGVPLNRFDNIRLTLTIHNAADQGDGTTDSRAPKISVTCVGETTALYKGGAASLAMY
jgi:hypothetical protein